MKIFLIPRLGLALLISTALALSGCAPRAPVAGLDEGLELLILHSNDTHAHIAGLDKKGSAAFEPADSRGGFGRLAAAINRAKAERDNVIALDAGDQFQGTLFYSIKKWPLLAELDQLMPWDAMTLGNHEFDEGCQNLQAFIQELPFPVLAANLAPGKGCPLAQAKTAPYLIKEIRGEKVAVVGLANDEIQHLAKACPQTRFRQAEKSLAAEVKKLEAQGIKHIIALTHLGLPADRELARRVDGVDVIVGGHTHSYLAPGSPDGPYPIVERSPNGNPVLVVTAKRAAQYLGEISVRFNREGVAVFWEGAARELGRREPSQPEIDALISRYLSELEEFRQTVVGQNKIDMADGMDACREQECLGGLLTADAMLELGRPLGLEIALYNGGGVRARLPQGQVSRGDILTMHPFGNVFVMRQYSGEQLWQALEHGLANEGAKGPRLLQVAGLRYSFDSQKPAGQRLVKVELIDERGRAKPLDLKASYGVALSDYLAEGGDGFETLKNGQLKPSPEPLIADVLESYIRRHSPLKDIRSGRLLRLN